VQAAKARELFVEQAYDEWACELDPVLRGLVVNAVPRTEDERRCINDGIAASILVV